MTQRLRAWSHARQRIGEPARTMDQALRAVVAVYATHPTSPLALWARTASFTAARYGRVDRSGRGIRIPAMRKTVFLVPRKHAARIFTAVRPTTAHALRPLKQLGLSEGDYERLAARILAAAEEPLPARELEKTVGIKGRELATVLRGLRYQGRLVTLAGESLNMSPHLYVDSSSWVPEGLEAGDAGTALKWLAGEYLRAYGPARVEDFAWWAGVTMSAARKATGGHRTTDIGDGLLLPSKDEPAFVDVKRPRGVVAVLPKWDAYTMGHAPDGRQRFVHPDVQRLVYTPIGTGLSGDGNPVVLVDGEAVATWTFDQKHGAQVQPFDTLGTRVRKRVDEKLQEIVALLVP